MLKVIVEKNGYRVISCSPERNVYKVQRLQGVWKELGTYKTMCGAIKRFGREVDKDRR